MFEQSLRLALEQGYLKRGRGMRVASDTTYILGRGAVKDIYNLLADGFVELMRALTTVGVSRCGAGLRPTDTSATWAPA